MCPDHRMRRCRPSPRARLASAALVALCAALVALGAATSVFAQGVGHEFIPLENWSYEAVERFEAMGLVRLPEDRPLTRDEFSGIVAKIADGAFDRRLAPRDRYNLARLQKEFTDFAGRRDPQARYDPPTLYLPGGSLLFTGDFDLVGSVQKDALDDREEWFVQSNPEFRIHFKDRVTYDVRYRWIMGPEHGDRARNEKPSRREKSFKGLTSLFERSYVIAAWDRFHFFLGREYVDWGPSDWNNLIVPGATHSLDQVGGRVRLGLFRLSFFSGLLSPHSERRLSGHRLEIGWKRVVLGINETVVYVGRGLDPVYLFPLSSFYANQFNERGDDNVLWSLDLKVNPLRGATIYGSFLVDDAQFERGEGAGPDKFAFDAGGRYALEAPWAATLRARYRFVDLYTYTHRDTVTSYTSGEADLEGGDVLLGGEPGPDTESWRVEVEAYPRSNVVVRGSAYGERIGEGNDMRAWNEGDPVNPRFPLPVVQRARGYGVSATWEFDRNQWVRAAWGWVDVSNAANVSRAERSGHAFRVEVRFEFL